MSLIADALRAAQRERDQRAAVAGPAQRAAREGFFSIRRRQSDSGRRRLVLGASISGVVVTMMLLAAGLARPRPGAVHAGAGEIGPAAAAAPVAVAAADSLVEDGDAEGASDPAAPEAEPVEPVEPVEPTRIAEAGPREAAPRGPLPGTARSLPRQEPDAADAAPSRVQVRMEAGPSSNFSELFAAALAAQNRGDLVRARELYEQILVLRPEWSQAHNNLGIVQRSLGQTARAEASFRRAVELEPELAAGWSNLGMLLAAAERVPEALGALRTALRLEPTAVATKVNLASVLHGSGAALEARALLDQVLQTAPSMPEAHYALARVLEDLQRPDDAATHYGLFLAHAAGRFPQLEERVRARVTALRGGGQ